MKIFSIHSPLVVIFCCRLVSSVNVSCKQELVTADLSLVIGSHAGLWLADIMTAWHAHKTGIIIITGERHAAGSAAVAQFYAAPDICRLQGTAGDEQGTSNLFWQQSRHLLKWNPKHRVEVLNGRQRDIHRISQSAIVIDEKVSFHWQYLLEQ